MRAQLPPAGNAQPPAARAIQERADGGDFESVPNSCQRFAKRGVLADIAPPRTRNLRAINAGRGTDSVPGHFVLSNTYLDCCDGSVPLWSPNGVQTLSAHDGDHGDYLVLSGYHAILLL